MRDDTFFEPEIETMPRAAIERLQEQRLMELLPRAYERGGLVRETWDAAGIHPRDIRSLADYRERAPFIDKDAVRRYRDTKGDPFGGILLVDERELDFIATSSGTTGDATFFPEVWQEHVWAPYLLSSARDFWHIGLRPGGYYMPGANSFKGPQVSGQLCGGIPLIVYQWFGGWPEIIEAIRRYSPTFVQMIGPMMIELAQMAHQVDLHELFRHVPAITFAGEPLGVKMKRKVAEWGPELYMWNSAGDCGVSYECRMHDGYHIWEDNVLVECVDPDGRAARADGEIGELVTTGIDTGWVAPLIRYRTEDLVRISREPCGCGRTHVRFWPLGRKGDETLVGGRRVMLMDVWAAVEEVPETENALFQMVRPKKELERLRLRVGYDTDITTNPDAVRDRLAQVIAARVGVEPEIELMTEKALLERGSIGSKFQRVAKQ
ncbi:MAG: phenylacetate--CoA ligase family protein [Gammaproteobacteria bacterium]